MEDTSARPNFKGGEVLEDGTTILAIEDKDVLALRGRSVFPTRASIFSEVPIVRTMDEQELTQLNIELGRFAISRRMVFADPDGSEVIILLREDKGKRSSYLVVHHGERFWTDTILERGWTYVRHLSHKEVEEIERGLRGKPSRCPHR